MQAESDRSLPPAVSNPFISPSSHPLLIYPRLFSWLMLNIDDFPTASAVWSVSINTSSIRPLIRVKKTQKNTSTWCSSQSKTNYLTGPCDCEQTEKLWLEASSKMMQLWKSNNVLELIEPSLFYCESKQCLLLKDELSSRVFIAT